MKLVGFALLILDEIKQRFWFLDPNQLIGTLLDWFGPWVYLALFFIVFAETGLAVGFFLPGDSLLVVAGLMAKTYPDQLYVIYVMLAFFLGSVIGDSTGYWTGRFMGKKLFNREDSRIFKPSRVATANKFFEKHGPKTVMFARFVPIVRTFAPMVVGASNMPYARFLPYSIAGGLIWIFSMVLGGYFLGSIIENAFGIKLEKHIEKVVIVVVLLSLTPAIIEYVRHKLEKSRSESQ
jgi:membrane-associated protein